MRLVRTIGAPLAAAAVTLACALPASAATQPVAQPAAAPSAQPAAVSPAAVSPAATPDYTGIIALDNCSGSLVKLPGAQDSDPALALTNGHCNENGFPAPGEVQVNEPSNRSMTLLGGDGRELGALHATKIVYSTMTDTDVTLYQLDSSYAQISSELGGTPLALSADAPANGTPISVVSGYFTRTWSCSIDTTVHELHEGDWVWKNSIRYTPECDTIHGTSGSPVIDDNSGAVVAINNTGNDSGEKCTLNNPCEVDENGQVFYKQGLTYGEQTNTIVGCMGSASEIDLDKAGCALPKPAAQLAPAA